MDNEALIRKLNERLISKNKEMEILVAHVAHELLTPVTSLLMTVDNLLDHYEQLDENGEPIYTNEECLAFADRISRNGHDLKDQAMHILQSFSQQKPDVKLEKINLSTIVRQAIEDTIPLCKEKQITIIDSLPEEANIIGCNQGLKIIVRNIIGNAIKFSSNEDSKKLINISIEEEDGIKLSVNDSGIGIPKDLLESGALFSSGTRGENAVTQEIRGHGLGLKAVKQLLEGMNGEIELTSEIGKGTKVDLLFKKEGEDLNISI